MSYRKWLSGGLVCLAVVCLLLAHGAGAWADTLALPEGTKLIADEAFCGDMSLDEVLLPEGVETIGARAFAESGAKRVYLPESLEYIAPDAFLGCEGLTAWGAAYSYAEGYCAEQEIHFDCDYTDLSAFSFTLSDTTATVTGYTGEDTVVVIPKMADDTHTITAIGNKAFSGQASLTAVRMPDTVTKIGTSAFAGCTGLTTIRLPRDLDSLDGSAFQGCVSLADVVFNEKLRVIGNLAFAECKLLTDADLPDSVVQIYYGAFRNDTALTSFHYPRNLERAQSNGAAHSIFSGCTSLTSIEVPEGVTALAQDIFAYHVSLTKVTLPSTLTAINANAFIGCTGLPSDPMLYIPPSVTSFGDNAFGGCSNLKIESEYGSTATAFAVTNDIPHYYLTPVGRMPSGVIYQGDPCALNLSIRSTDVIESVSIALTDAAGQAVYQRDCAPGEALFYLWPDISDAMDIPHLPLGEYTLTVNAATALTRETYTSRFEVKEPPLRLNTDDATLPNRYIHLQQTLNMLGTITSNYPMTSVTATLQKQDGTYSETYQAGPNDTSLALMPIANHFGVITATGPYYFTFTITGHGETITLFDGEMMCTETYDPEEVRWDPLMSSGIDQYLPKRGFWSAELAVGAYGDGKSFARSCWFRDVRKYNHPTNIAAIMMWKDTDNLDGTYTRVWCVGVQGTPTTSVDQWLSNLTLGEGGYHAGFLGAAQTVLEDFRSYRAQISEAHPRVSGVEYTPNDKIWIAGHSRGAAVTNILGGDLILDEGFAADDIYAFCFACPNVMKGGDSYCNQVKVYNLDGDLVTHVAAWGYGRYGDVEHFDVRVLGNNEHLKRIPITNYSDIKPYVDMVEAIEPDSLPDLLDRVRTYVQTNNLGYALDVLDGVIIVISNAKDDLALGLGEAAVDRALYVIQTPFRPYEDDVGLFDAHGRESYRTLMASQYPSFAYGDYSR